MFREKEGSDIIFFYQNLKHVHIAFQNVKSNKENIHNMQIINKFQSQLNKKARMSADTSIEF